MAEDAFEGVNEKDGFHVIKTEGAERLTLSVVVYANGELQIPPGGTPDDAAIEVLEIDQPTNVQRGAAVRLELVMDAIARFLTTGGQWRELEAAAQRMRKLAVGGLAFPGYHLVDSYSTTDGTYQHVFARDDNSGEAILWEEPRYNTAGGLVGGFIDRTTLDRIRNQQDEDGWRETTTEEVEPDHDSLPLQLDAGLGGADGLEGGVTG